MDKRCKWVCLLLVPLVFVTGCGGGAGFSSRHLVEEELYAGLSYFCVASDALDKEALAKIFSRRFLAEKRHLNYHMQTFMEDHGHGDTLDYTGLMQYFDFEIDRQKSNQNVSHTTITSFSVVWSGATEAITSHRLRITSTQSGEILADGNLRWVKENGMWKIQSILGTNR